MFEHGMICVRDGREGYKRPCAARMFEHGKIYSGLSRVSEHHGMSIGKERLSDTAGAEAAVSSVGFV